MQTSLAAMQTALRVLSALNDRLPAASSDVDELHRLAPGRTDRPLDELACEVIQFALQARAKARTAGR